MSQNFAGEWNGVCIATAGTKTALGIIQVWFNYFAASFFMALGNVNVDYLKIPKKHRGPHKTPSRAHAARLRVWGPCYKRMHLSTIRTHFLPALLALKACMRQNAKRKHEDSLPCKCYAIKSNSRTICTQVSQLPSADRKSSGHEWTANSSLHNPRTVNMVLVHCGCRTGK